MFVNREKELQILEEEYRHEAFRFSVIYGRRRVGKTSLIKQFITPRPSIYFLVTLETEVIVIERFKMLVADFFDDDLLRSLPVQSIDQVFSYIAQKEFPQKLVIVIDEFQYLSKINPSTASIFQRIIDEICAQRNIMLILCGSIISMMYKETLSYDSPLYGRRTSAIKLEALKPLYLKHFFKKKTPIELLELYSCLYGVPKYLEMFQDKNNIFDSIEKNILSRNAFLFDEPRFILQNEVSETMTYFTILEVIANGEHKIGNIAGRLNKNVQNITSFMAKLIELELIYKEIPITEINPHKSKKGLYFIKDNFFRFWFRYVLPYKSQLEMDNTSYVMGKIKESFPEYVSKTFEEHCIRETLHDSRFDLLKCGRWWNKANEIDVVGVGEDHLVVGECKYSNKKVGTDILEKLEMTAKNIDSDKPIKYYLLFSKSGFTEKLRQVESIRNDLILMDWQQRALR